MGARPLRILAFLCRLFFAAIKAGVKPVQYLSSATLRRLATCYSVAAKLLGSRPDRPGPPDTKSKKPPEERRRGSFEVLKILDGDVVALDGVHRSSYPLRLSLHHRSTESIRMEDSNPDGPSPHDDQQPLSPISLNHSSEGSYGISIQEQSPETRPYQILKSQRFSVETTSTPSRSGSPNLQVDSTLGQGLQPSLRSTRSLLQRDDEEVHRRSPMNDSPVIPSDMGGDYSSRWQSGERGRSRSPAPSRVSVSSMSAQADFNVVPLPRAGSPLPYPFRHNPSIHRQSSVWEGKQDQYSNRPIPALNATHLVPFSPDQNARYDRRRAMYVFLAASAILL